MKKYLYLLTAALVLSVGTLAAGHLRVNGARDKMEIRETVIKGDPAAAAGLAVTCHTRDWDGHLLWDTAFTPGETEKAKSVFRLSGEGEADPRRWSDSVQLEQINDLFSIGGGHLSPGDPANPQCMLRPVWDVASRTAAGEERTETVRLADYYEYYPITLNTYSTKYPNSSFDVYGEESEWLGEYFKVRVDETAVREVTVEKDGEGQIISVGMDVPRQQGGAGGCLASCGVVTERGIFLIAESVDVYGEFDDRLECRDGPGVHLIRYREDREDEGAESYLELFAAELFYPTGDARTLWLGVSPDESELLLYTWEDGKLVLTVLDTATGKVLQRLDLIETEGESSWYFSVIEGDGLYLAVSREHTFSLVSREGGRYEQVLKGALELESAEDWRVLSGVSVLAWDGRRMALASTNPSAMFYYQETRPDSAIGVGVWDEGGPCFLGTYRCGLSFEPVSEYEYAREPLSLTFHGT